MEDIAVKESCDILRILNDDCLKHVLEHLDIKDINAVNKCSRRLNGVAASEIKHKFRTEPVSMESHGWRTVKNYAVEVRHFIVNQRLFTHKVMDNLMNILEQFSNLEKLEIRDIANANLFSKSKLGRVLSKIKELELHFIHRFEEWPSRIIKPTMANCQQLEILRISGYFSHEFFDVHYPKLREMHLLRGRFFLSTDLMTNTYIKNSHIRKLSLTYMIEPQKSWDFTGLETMTNLEELYIEAHVQHIKHPNFRKMVALKKLSLIYYSNQELPQMYTLDHIDLEELHIVAGIPDELEHPLSTFPKQITSIEISDNPFTKFTILDVINFVRERPKLQKFIIPFYIRFQCYNAEDVIGIPPDVMKQLVSQRVAYNKTQCNYINHDKLQLKSSKLYFTHIGEISDLDGITFEKLSQSSELLSICRQDIIHTRQAKFATANSSNECESIPISFAGNSKTQNQRIVFLCLAQTWYPIRL